MQNPDEMYVTKRDGQIEIVSFDKILRRIKSVGTEVGIKINYTSLAMKVIDQLYDKISTAKIDELTAEQCASMSSIHYYYGTLAARVAVSNHHKNTDPSFTNVINRLYNFLDKNGNHSPLVSDDLHRIANQYEREIQEALDFNRDYLFDYFGFKTLEKSYLMRINGQIVERPQHMWMRVSLGIHCQGTFGSQGTFGGPAYQEKEAIKKAIESYNLMSQKYFTHATPTLFNSGTPRPQMSSCYLIAMENDSIDGIYNTLKDCALISKWAGGIGLHIHNVRATNSHIRGTNGTSNGIVPMLRVFNNTAKYVDQGGGRRHGSFAIYLEPWHADIEKFLEMRKNHGDEELKARDLFYALWIPDLFMERVKADSTWTLMCPDECPGLADVYGPEFTALYSKYESEGKGRATIKARDLWLKVLDAQMETGTPYLCYKDASNQKSNQKNIGTIKSSNLCVAPETLVLTDQGNQRIDTLVGKKVNVWNGEEWSEVEVFKTGTNRPLMCVTTDANNTLYCTESHKFYLEDGNQINAVNLKTGDRLLPLDNIVQTVLSVSGVIRHDDTYCFTEPKRHMGVFNGILTGQCTEINEVSTPDETAVCNLASIGLPTFIEYKGTEGAPGKGTESSRLDAFAKPTFNYEKLKQIAKVVTNNLNRVIDVNYYPTQKTQTSNLKHRPIGIGVQGLADVYALLDLPFYSDEAKEINKRIFETIYYGALEQSMELAKEEGPYETFQGSPASQGILQFDMWQKGITDAQSQEYSSSLDWASLKANIVKYGLRNSLLVAPMPTASTSQILGFNECFEPFTSNIYSRRTLAGEFILTNKYLMKELIAQGLWNTELKNNIIANQGSIQHITTLSEHMRNKYKTVWEIPMRHIIDMAADRGQYICQSQSMNLWQEDPTYASLTSMHFYAWQKGLKTGIYYLRRRAKHRAQQFTIEPKKEEECLMCSA